MKKKIIFKNTIRCGLFFFSCQEIDHFSIFSIFTVFFAKYNTLFRGLISPIFRWLKHICTLTFHALSCSTYRVQDLDVDFIHTRQEIFFFQTQYPQQSTRYGGQIFKIKIQDTFTGDIYFAVPSMSRLDSNTGKINPIKRDNVEECFFNARLVIYVIDNFFVEKGGEAFLKKYKTFGLFFKNCPGHSDRTLL